MSRIYLVRHGRAAVGFGSQLDPPLHEIGRAQAQIMADDLGPRDLYGPLSSPLRRTRETAAALERAWSVEAQIEPRVGEIPTPVADPAERVRWLAEAMKCRWSELDDQLKSWRAGVIEAVSELRGDAVVVSHFVAINVVVGHASGDDRMVCFRPDYCSCTLIDIVAGRFQLVELGVQATTRVL